MNESQIRLKYLGELKKLSEELKSSTDEVDFNTIKSIMNVT